MEIARIAAVGIIGAAMAIVLKKDNPGFAMFTAAATGIVIILMTLPYIQDALGLLTSLEGKATTAFTYAPELMKILGICYIAEFGAETLRDAGEQSIAAKVEFGGKMLILAIAAPIVVTLLDKVFGLLNGY